MVPQHIDIGTGPGVPEEFKAIVHERFPFRMVVNPIPAQIAIVQDSGMGSGAGHFGFDSFGQIGGCESGVESRPAVANHRHSDTAHL